MTRTAQLQAAPQASHPVLPALADALAAIDPPAVSPYDVWITPIGEAALKAAEGASVAVISRR